MTPPPYAPDERLIGDLEGGPRRCICGGRSHRSWLGAFLHWLRWGPLP